MRPYMVISADCHAGLPAPLYRPYLEKKHWDDFDRYIEKTASGRGDTMKRLFSEDARATTWPHSRIWLSRALADVPDEERRLILGENAARAYRMDVGKLESDVERIGLRPEDLNAESADQWSDLVYGAPPE